MTLKNALSRAANSVLGPLGLELRRRPLRLGSSGGIEAPRSCIVTLDDAERHSFMREPNSGDGIVHEIAGLAESTFAAVLTADTRPTRELLTRYIAEFIELYHDRPLPVNSHGGGFNNCLWLYLTARVLKPTLVVESGAMRGQSSWVLRMAAKDAEQHCFDIDLSRLAYRDASIHYHEHDWNSFDLGTVHADTSLIFFDDHVSHQKRILEAKAKGFRHIVFDDNLPIYQLCKEPDAQVAPTLDMIFDPALTEVTRIRCVCRNEDVEISYVPEDSEPVRAAVAAWQNFPQAHLDRFNMKNRLGGPSKFALCRLVDGP